MKRKKDREKHPHPDAPWTPFEQCDYLMDANGRQFPVPAWKQVAKNNHYTVDMVAQPPHEIFGECVWFSIKRNDRKPIHDWRDLQRIKNELAGPECEAIEIYPAESRLVDTSNQYHLWVFRTYKLPYGYSERLVVEGNTDHPMFARSVQRPFRGHQRPEDLMTADELVASCDADPTVGSKLVDPKK